MATWSNADTLSSWKKLQSLKGMVSVKDELSSADAVKRIKEYSVPMAEGLTYNYAAKQVNEQILKTLQELSDESQLLEKFEALYNGEVVNTGEKRMVLHQLTRGQLGKDVIADGVNKRDFYIKEQKRIAEFADKVHSGKIVNEKAKNSLLFARLVLVVQTLGHAQCILHLKTGQRRIIHSRWKLTSFQM